MPENYYEILGVERASTKDEIKTKFRVQILKYHPDKISRLPEKEKTEAEERSKEIINAYKILSDETARKNYDNELRQGLNFSNNMSDEKFYEFEDFTGSESTFYCGKHELKLKESILNFTNRSNEKTKERFIHKDSFQPLFNYFNLSKTRLNNLAYKKQEGQSTVILNDKYRIVAEKMHVLATRVSDSFDELDDGYNSSDRVLAVLNGCKQILEEAQNDEDFNEHNYLMR